VTWSVVETGGGTITDAGVYTAPAIDGTYHVKAVSAVNANWPVTATVKVVPKSVIVTIDPTSATVTANGSKTFTATVTGPSNTKVTWSVEEQNGGSITSSGVYTAPATAGTYHVKAVSAADPSKSATATVNVGSTTSASIVGNWKVIQNDTAINAFAESISLTNSGTITLKESSYQGTYRVYEGTYTYKNGTINYKCPNATFYYGNTIMSTGPALESGTLAVTFQGDSMIWTNGIGLKVTFTKI